VAYHGAVRRLGSLAALLILAAVTASAALGVQAPPIRFRPISGPIGSGTANQPGLTVTVSSHRAGAKPVTVTIRYIGPLRCGRPMGATIVLPSAVGVGTQTSVMANGKPGTVVKQGHTLKVSSPSSHVTCDSIVVGPITLQVGGLTNPAKAGTYVLHVASAAATYAGAFSVQ
jgi:hypothetical protein